MFHLFVCPLKTSLQGSEIETLARTQEQESDAKTRRYHLDRQRVWFLVELLHFVFFLICRMCPFFY